MVYSYISNRKRKIRILQLNKYWKQEVALLMKKFGFLFVLFLSSIFVLNVNAQNKFGERVANFERFNQNRSIGGQREIVVNGQTRNYLLRTPSLRSRQNQKLPLVIALHGGGGNSQNAERMMGWTQKGQSEGFAVVYPNGSGLRGNLFLTFNGKHCCSYAMQNNIDDVAFISKLIDELVANNQVDPRRVFVTGMSNGAIMSHRLGAELSHKITAIAPVVGTVFGDEQMPKSPVSALIINGSLDNNVSPAGGFSQGRSRAHWGSPPMKPAAEQGAFWAKANFCSNPRTFTRGQIQITDYECPRGIEVEQIMVLDNGHAWPGGQKGSSRGDEPSNSYNATVEIWNFFKNKYK